MLPAFFSLLDRAQIFRWKQDTKIPPAAPEGFLQKGGEMNIYI